MITLLGIAIPLLPAATKLGQGNVFTGVCDSVHRGGLPQCMLGYHPPPQTKPPREQTPPPGTRPPWEQTPPPGADTPHPPGSRPPLSRHTPQEQTPSPPEQTPPGSRRHHTVNERPVRILLKCILVFDFSLNWSFIDRRRPFCSDHVVKFLYSCDLWLFDCTSGNQNRCFLSECRGFYGRKLFLQINLALIACLEYFYSSKCCIQDIPDLFTKLLFEWPYKEIIHHNPFSRSAAERGVRLIFCLFETLYM